MLDKSLGFLSFCKRPLATSERQKRKRLQDGWLLELNENFYLGFSGTASNPFFIKPPSASFLYFVPISAPVLFFCIPFLKE
jgi:hypothetical protein